jgi:hypothetical protein
MYTRRRRAARLSAKVAVAVAPGDAFFDWFLFSAKTLTS